ncbi:MAG: thioredoxin [Treponema sp.]|nr:MAG: thioredoxin [Treponema sp.]
MAVLHLTPEDFDKTLETDLPVLVDFWAPWCGPCKMIGPELEKAEAELSGKAIVAKVNVDEASNKGLAAKYGVRSIPNLVVIKNGKEVDRGVGFMDKAQLVELVSKHF